MEVSVAGVLLATLLTICLQLLGVTASRRHSLEDRQTAVLEAANAMERLAAQPWEDLTGEMAAAMRLSDEARQSLAEGRLDVDVADAAGEPAARRITVTVGWIDRSGKPQQPVRLVAWRYRDAKSPIDREPAAEP